MTEQAGRTVGRVLLAGLIMVAAQIYAGNASMSRAGDLKAGLDVKLRLSALNGEAIERPASGEAFHLSLRLQDAATHEPAGGLHPAAWLRPVEASNLACNRAAETYNRTSRLPIGTIDVNGALVAVLHDDARVSMVDPRLDLATSNILSIADLGARPRDFVADQAAMRVVTGDGERLRAVLVDGRMTPTEVEEKAFAFLVATERAPWAGEGHTIHRLSGREPATIETGSPVLRMKAASLPPDPDELRQTDPMAPELLAIVEDGSVILVSADGRIQSLVGEAGTRDAVYVPRAAGALVLRGDGAAEFRRADGGVSRPLALPASATRLAISANETIALAWAPGESAISFIDVAGMMVSSAVSFDRPIRELEIAGTVAYALLDDLSSVMVSDLAVIAPGQSPQVENVRLGPSAMPPEASGPYLVPLPHGGGVLALNRETQTVFVVQAGQGEGMPPMTAFRLKGGMPRALALLDRSLREVEPGRYETAVSAPAGGPWELVVTTGLAALSACFRIDVEGPESAEMRRTLTIRAVPVTLDADRSAELVLALDTDALDMRLRERLPFMVMALDRPWQMPIVAKREAGSNRYFARLVLPGPGQYPIIPGFSLAEGDRIVPGLLRADE